MKMYKVVVFVRANQKRLMVFGLFLMLSLCFILIFGHPSLFPSIEGESNHRSVDVRVKERFKAVTSPALEGRPSTLIILGTRPEAIKLWPIIKEMNECLARDESEGCPVPVVVVTGQHKEMMFPLLKLFGIEPDFEVDTMVAKQTLSSLTSRLFVALGEVVAMLSPDLILVQGDTTSAMVASMVAYYNRIPVAHVEAGLRTYDIYQPFPEEINRRVIDLSATLHFAPTERSRKRLLEENLQADVTLVTGNTVVDAARLTSKIPPSEKTINYFRRVGLSELLSHVGVNYVDQLAMSRSPKVILVTSHRRENHGDILVGICRAILDIVNEFSDVHIVFPVHLNPKVREVVPSLLGNDPQIHLTDPMDYEEMIYLMSRLYMIVTDSGGLQEEASFFGLPVLVIREITERPEGVEMGVAKLSGTMPESIKADMRALLNNQDGIYDSMSARVLPYGDGYSAEKIVEEIRNFLGK